MVNNFNMSAFLFPKQVYFVSSGLKIIGHGNPDNNIETTYSNYKCFLHPHDEPQAYT
jgi:hypothetical protein